MSTSHYCQEKKEIAEINAEDENKSDQHRADWIKAAQMWGDLADHWLELELRQNLFPGGIIKRD